MFSYILCFFLFITSLMHSHLSFFFFFFFNDTATTEIYTLSLHDALPISLRLGRESVKLEIRFVGLIYWNAYRSEEHTSELQSHSDLVCRLLLEKKKKKRIKLNAITN